ncbi:MAG TPA: hypothetical protein VEK08_12990 [Planctomycetota bacterium]|nr:hypothetical protein [Planctomycetota bacterium]
MARTSSSVIVWLRSLPSSVALQQLLASQEIKLCAMMRWIWREGRHVGEIQGALPQHFLNHCQDAELYWNGQRLDRQSLLSGPEKSTWGLTAPGTNESNVATRFGTAYAISEIPNWQSWDLPDESSLNAHFLFALNVDQKWIARGWQQQHNIIWPWFWMDISQNKLRTDKFIIFHLGLLIQARNTPAFSQAAQLCSNNVMRLVEALDVERSALVTSGLSHADKLVYVEHFKELPLVEIE